MPLLSKIDAYGKPGWLALTVILFWIGWPLGLGLVAYLIASGRLQSWLDELRLPGVWFNLSSGPAFRRPFWAGTRASGSGAFDAYRDRTLRELEEQQREFQAYLDRLRRARDKEEFGAFMAERRANAAGEIST